MRVGRSDHATGLDVERQLIGPSGLIHSLRLFSTGEFPDGSRCWQLLMAARRDWTIWGSRDLQPEQLVFVLKMCCNRRLRA